MAEYLKLIKSNCKNCYKCIRNCPVKSIRFSAGQANIVGNECILCGECFVVCPQNAKEIVSEREQVQVLLNSGAPVIASVAPSFVANYGVGIGAMETALRALGFAGAEETAVGATLVKKEYERLLREDGRDVLLSSCCHSANLLVQKYFPDLLPYLADVLSPMQAHGQDIRRRHPDAKVVFIGPCVAKKDEAAYYEGTIDAVLTFEELTEWMDEAGVTFPEGAHAEDEPHDVGRTRVFPTTGGVLKSMDCDMADYTYLAVDGVDNCIAVLEDLRAGGIHHCFIELSACAGSCVGGPVMAKYHRRAAVRDYARVAAYAGDEDFPVEPLPSMEKYLEAIAKKLPMPTDAELSAILAQMGKTRPEDELNCGTCGYNTCREKAIAIFQGKAEISMCLPFLKEKAESFSENILNNTPNGILVLNEELEVQQINHAAMQLMNLRSAADVLGEPVVRILDPTDFIQVRRSGHDIRDKRVFLAEYGRYADITIVYDRAYRLLIAILRDVTEEESARARKESISRETVETADRVVDKQMRIVQEIASLLGETAAETKIALTKLKESICDE